MAETKTPIISFRNFSFQYRAQKQPTLHDIDLDIYPGERVLIAGPSGSGKSTLAACINGLNPFSNPGECKGSLIVDGVDAPHSSIFELAGHVGTVLQDPDGQFIGLTVGEDIAFALENSCTPQEEMHEIKLFRNALDFSEVKLRECIVPRPDVVALSIDSSIEELTQLFIDTGLSRILIYKESIDDIIGYVHISTLFKDPPTIAKALSRVLIVPETMSAQRLLNLFIRDQKSVAVVVDEFGITAGIVTIEDIMEEIFGEIEDEHDHLNLKEVMISEQEYIFSGRLEVDYLNEKYHLDLEEREEYETLAGLVLYFNQSIPQEGETIVVNNLTFKILSVKNARIEEIKVCM